MLEYKPAKRLSLKGDPTHSEKWLQERIADDPSILGLGELVLRDVERPQPRAGRLDLLLSDPVTKTRYETEIQLGSTDETHIVRTIEYWDIERTRLPQYEHVAVLVAEDITSRFFNVIGLFNRAIPMVAIELSALEVAGYLTLNFTTVLDLQRRATEEEDEPTQPASRADWEARGSPESMALLGRLHALVRDATGDSAIELKYNKAYIGLARNGVPANFVMLHPRKKGVVFTEFKLKPSEELSSRIDEAGFDVAGGYDPRYGRYYVRLRTSDAEQHHDLLIEMIRRAADVAEEPGLGDVSPGTTAEMSAVSASPEGQPAEEGPQSD
jgi:hypothetical protein